MSDTAYMDAVRRGDLSTAQRLVDAAANAAGYTVGPVWHGSDRQFNQFDLSKASPASEGLLFFSRKPRGYGKYLRSFYLRGVDRFVPDNGYATFRKKVGGRWQFSTDGSYADETVSHIGSDTLVVGDPSQIKSADPVTYDDAGNVIPLSQRFDASTEDIRNPRTAPKQFPYEYAAYLKAHFPEIWAAGGNIRGNDTYRWWTAYRKGDRSPTVMRWWNVTRPAWIARHYRDHRLPGVIAQIKWGTVGTLGVAGMKRVVEDAIRKRYAN